MFPGLALALVVAGVATAFGHFAPLIGGPVFGIALGAVVATVHHPGATFTRGLSFAGKYVLQASIVVLGTGLALSQVLRVGRTSLPVMIGTLVVALTGAMVLGRLLRVPADARLLIGVGTGICGASAIAAVTAVVDVAEAEVAYAIGTIFLFNVIAVLTFPPIGHLLGLSQHAFGLWAGTAINDTSSVVAAAYTYGQSAGATAVVVKLTRTLMIIPITVGLSWFVGRRRDRTESTGTAPTGVPWRRVFPIFIIGFLAASALDSVGVIPGSWHHGLATLGVFLITVALSAIGLSVRLDRLRATGVPPLALGGILWVLVAVSSLLLQAATGNL
jgi:uncharacterized integral membrane protein (TIGR00698 family)